VAEFSDLEKTIGHGSILPHFSVIIANMIYNFSAGKSPLIIGVRGFIVAGLP
jgi:hypothetical protein